MKKYRVNVNNHVYEIEIEQISESEVSTSSAPVSTPAKPSAPADGEKISSPMPGTILNINVKAGDVVKQGQVLMILEALKMENEIMAPRDGKIASINVSKGASVESGTLLCVLE